MTLETHLFSFWPTFGRCQQWASQPPPDALVTHSFKSWSICCVRQSLALHSPPGRSMLSPINHLFIKMKWCGGMTFFLVTLKDLCHRSGCTPRDRAMWTCFCAGVCDNREFQRALWGKLTFLNMPCLLGWGREGSGYYFLPFFRLQWKRSEAPSPRCWIGKVPSSFFYFFSPPIDVWIWYEW